MPQSTPIEDICRQLSVILEGDDDDVFRNMAIPKDDIYGDLFDWYCGCKEKDYSELHSFYAYIGDSVCGHVAIGKAKPHTFAPHSPSLARGDVCAVLCLVVKKSLRGGPAGGTGGVGQFLMDAAFSEAAALGMPQSSTYVLWVYEENTGAQRFYKRFGFADTSIRRKRDDGTSSQLWQRG